MADTKDIINQTEEAVSQIEEPRDQVVANPVSDAPEKCEAAPEAVSAVDSDRQSDAPQEKGEEGNNGGEDQATESKAEADTESKVVDESGFVDQPLAEAPASSGDQGDANSECHKAEESAPESAASEADAKPEQGSEESSEVKSDEKSEQPEEKADNGHVADNGHDEEKGEENGEKEESGAAAYEKSPEKTKIIIDSPSKADAAI
jgi:hypothetical protein